jgi:peroxiredoxin
MQTPTSRTHRPSVYYHPFPCAAALGTVLDHEGPMSVLGNPRSKRFAIYADDGVIKAFHVSEGPDATDPAGDDDPSASCVDAMLAAIDSSAKDEL